MLHRRQVLTGALTLAGTAVLAPFARAEMALRGDLVPGALVRGRTDPNANVSIDGHKLNLTPKGDFAFGFAYDRVGPASLKIDISGGVSDEKLFELVKREYK